MTPGRLLAMLGDADWRVRYEVASRVDAYELAPLLDDPDPLVRELARSRSGFTEPAQLKPATEPSP